jgi:Nif-specific regulatory protein
VNNKPDRIINLTDALASLLEQEGLACQQALSALIESAKAIQGEAADRRLQQLTAQMRALRSRFGLLVEMGRADFLAKIRREAESLAAGLPDSRASSVITPLIGEHPCTPCQFYQSLLDRLIEATSAQRGFVLLYLAESTEADVVAARNFQTRNLSLSEYSFSRTLIRQVLEREQSLLVEDASRDQSLSKETSVINLGLKSVVAVPLRHSGRTIGVVYLENNSLASAFDQGDLRMVEAVAQFAASYLDHLRLLPVTFERAGTVFFDESKASKEIKGRDTNMLSLLEVISRLADSPATILIEGESGTGKELIARALHYQSSRRDRPFVAINCAAIPDNLLESELFGHEKGAFTGATDRYVGRIERGDGGTIFLDEISELAYPLQAKMLRFLQSNEFDRLGGKKTIRVNVRVVAATSKGLKSLVELGKFHEALYYRLNVIPVRVPPLRERKGDIELLINHFLEKFSTVYGKRATADRGVYEMMKDYSFPGNVRELENIIHRLVALAPGDVIGVGDLPAELLDRKAERVSLRKDPLRRILETPPADLEELRRRKQQIKRAIAEQERALIERVIEESNGNMTIAASRLGMHRITLHKLLRRNKGADH